LTQHWDHTIRAAETGKLAHALLLGGPRGTGKDAFAVKLAAWLLCEGGPKPCGSCRSCRLLKAGSHPNAWLLRPDGLFGLAWAPQLMNESGLVHWQPREPEKKRDIPVDGVRELLSRIHLSSHYGARKVAVFAPADALNASSEDALLKTFEEPPADTHLVLVSEKWRTLAATLRSRCQILRFSAPQLRAPGGECAEGWSRALADAAEGKLQALRIAQGLKRDAAQQGLESWLHTANGWLRALAAPGQGPRPPAGLDAENVVRLCDETLEALRALERNGNPSLLVESIIIRLSQRG